MRLSIPEEKIIKEQEIEIKNDISIIYGCNNNGKTTFLKVLNQVFYNRMMESFLLGSEAEMSVCIPTNRVTVSRAATENTVLKDLEEFIHDQQEAYEDYGLHLKRIRD